MDYTAQNHVFSKRLDWDFSTTELFSFFADLPWAILLDSADADHTDAHVDIICAAPIATLVTKDASTYVSYNENRTPLQPLDVTQAGKVINTRYTSEPFSVIDTYMQQFYPQKKKANYAFSGGVMGAFSYDLGRRIETLPTIAKHDISLPELNLGFYDWALIYDYQQQAWSLVHYQNEEQWTATYNTLVAFIDSKLKKCAEKTAFSLSSPWQNQIDFEQYQDKFNQIQRYLISGDCYQINLTQRFSAHYAGCEWSAYTQLRKSNSAPFSAFIKLTENTIMSISPERFIQLQADEIQTKPIKGTMPRYADPIKDAASAKQLQQSDKDRAENLMIVDLLRNDIGKVAQAGSVRVPALFNIESFPAVHHLVSTITAKLKHEFSATDLLKASFPGGSITGAPKIRAMEIIEELEPSRRSLYCGSIGYISQDGKMDSSITIRTLVTEKNQIYCWAGGGIVADSQADAEYKETYDKVSRILPILNP